MTTLCSALKLAIAISVAMAIAACGESSSQHLDAKPGVSVGGAHCLSLSAAGVLTVVGANHRGQLGIATDTLEVKQPRPVVGVPQLALARAGNAHSVVLAVDGRAFVFGDNRYGQLGRPQPSFTSTPQRVDIGEELVDIATGGAHVVGLGKSGQAYGWGSNEQMQLGIDSVRQVSSPLRLHFDVGVKSIAASGAHSALLLADGSVYVFGGGKRFRQCCWAEATSLTFGIAALHVRANERVVAEIPLPARAAPYDCGL